MHLLKAQAGAIDDGADPIDLGQTPGDIVVITSADTEIAGLARAKEALGESVPSLRLANILRTWRPRAGSKCARGKQTCV